MLISPLDTTRNLQKTAGLYAYLYYARIRIIAGFAYNFDVLIRLAANFITLLMTVFIWKAAYNNTGTISGVDRDGMTTYAIMSIMLTAFFTIYVPRLINQKVRDGTISGDFLKPIHVMLAFFFDDLGSAFNALILTLLPLLLFSILFIQFPRPASLTALGFFLISAGFSYLILWMITAMTGLIAFWTLELGNLNFVRTQLIRILSGSYVPIWFFPEWFQKVSEYLPFIYIYQAPLGIYIGKIGIAEAGFILSLQAAWVCVLTALFLFLWSRARLRIVVQGG